MRATAFSQYVSLAPSIPVASVTRRITHMEESSGGTPASSSPPRPKRWRYIAIGAAIGAIASHVLLIGSFYLYKRDETNFLAAQNDPRALANYLKNCSPICSSRAKAEIRLREFGNPNAASFTFTVCNKSSFKASVAVSGRKDPLSDAENVTGWHTVEPGACNNLGEWAKGVFHFMAADDNNPKRGWRGDGAVRCVPTSMFDRVIIKYKKCEEGERLERFFTRTMTGDFTWNLSP